MFFIVTKKAKFSKARQVFPGVTCAGLLVVIYCRRIMDVIIKLLVPSNNYNFILNLTV